MKRALAIAVIALAICGRSRAAETNVPITLAEGFQKVLSNDPELLRLRKDVERATGTRLEIHSRDLASLSVWPTLGLEGGPLYGGKNKQFALVSAQFSQPLLNRGIAATWRRGNVEVLAAEQNLNAATAKRLNEFRIYFLRAQRLQQLIALYQELGRRLEANVTAEQQRRNVGGTGPRPLLQARVQLLAERAELNAFQREDFEVRSTMAEMMGDVEHLPLPAEPLSHQTVKVDVKAGSELAEQRREDLKFLRILIRGATEDRRIVDAGYFPYISAIGSGLYVPGKKPIYQATPLFQGQQPLGTDIRGGLNLTWQIVDNGRVTGERRQVEAVRVQYQLVLAQLEQNIPRDLERISHALENTDAKLNALQKATTEAEEGLKLIESRISLGEATQLDFSDAQRNLLAVRHGVIDALFQHASALAELDLATGRYLEFAEPLKGP